MNSIIPSASSQTANSAIIEFKEAINVKVASLIEKDVEFFERRLLKSRSKYDRQALEVKLYERLLQEAKSAHTMQRELRCPLIRGQGKKKQEVLDVLFEGLHGFFDIVDHQYLRYILEGEKVDRMLTFLSNANRFIEFWKRMLYNKYVVNSKMEIANWICSNFMYKYVKGNVNEVRSFNKNTVWTGLKYKGPEPRKEQRICIFDWLPYKPLK